MIIIIILISIIFVAVSAFSIGLMRFITLPKYRTPCSESKSIETRDNLWGNFDLYEKITFNMQMDDGYLLHGLLIPGSCSGKFVIITHGYTYNKFGGAKYVNVFHELGYNAVIYDIRHHGDNKDFFCSMGHYESKDICNIARILREKYGQDISIGLHGESLGAASSLLALGSETNFSFCVADCPFTDLGILLEDLGWNIMHIPKPLSHLASFASFIIHGYRLDHIKPIDSFKTNTSTPVCFIHGADDKFIPPAHSSNAYNSCKQYKELHLILHAGHAESYKFARDEYHNIVSTFLENC